jgi:DNA polymerase-3 subunit epsilon
VHGAEGLREWIDRAYETGYERHEASHRRAGRPLR